MKYEFKSDKIILILNSKRERRSSDQMNYPKYIAEIISRLESAGEEAYVVGGCVRDSLLGIKANDFDIATSSLPEKTIALFSDKRVIETGLKHGTVTVITCGESVEITTFRVDGSYTDSRHPDSVHFTRRIEEDLSRRDFTVNAMAFSEKRGLVDVFGGRDDINARVIRAVRDPSLRFEEDALRIMRAFRFSAQLGFSIEENTLRGAIDKREGLSHIARERICSEFIKLLCARAPKDAVLQMMECDILKYVTNDITPQIPALDALCEMPAVDIARLGLFFSGSAEEDIRRILNSLKCSGKQITGILAVARGSLMCVDSPVAATSLIAAVGDYAPYAARASYLLGNSPENAEALVAANRAPSKISELAIGGRELMALGAYGAEIGRILNALLSMAMKDPEINQKEKLTEKAKGLINESRT